MRTWLTLVLLAASAVLVYADRASNRFVWDDWLFRDGTDSVLYDGFDLKTTHTRLYRPLRVWAYTQVFGWSGTREAGYHVFATVVHALAALAVYALLRTLRLRWPAFGALLFAVHPVHTESIVFITASFDQLAVVLYVASLSALALGIRARIGADGGAWGPAWHAASLGLGGLALLGSEFAATLPVAALLVALLLLRREGLSVPWPVLAGHLGLLAGYLALRIGVAGLGARSGTHLGGDLISAVASTTVIFVEYLRLLVWPAASCVFYNPVHHHGFFEPPVLASTALLAGLGLASLRALGRGSPLGLPFLFFLLALAPVSNLIPSTTPMAERYLYLPSVGLCVLAACVPAPRWPGAGPRDGAIVLAAAGVLAVLASVSWSRAADWRDDQTLFTRAVQCAPGNASAWNNLGLAQLEAGSPAEARRSLAESLRLRPDYAEAWNNLGRVQEALGLDPLETYRQGLAQGGGSPELWVNLAAALQRAGRLDEAERAARDGLAVHPATAELWGNLGQVLLSQGRPAEAQEALLRGVRLQPHQPELWVTLAEAKLRLGDPAGAVSALERATRTVRPSARAHYNLAILLEPGAPRRAAEHYRHYLRLAPGAADAGAVRQRISRLEGSREVSP